MKQRTSQNDSTDLLTRIQKLITDWAGTYTVPVYDAPQIHPNLIGWSLTPQHQLSSFNCCCFSNYFQSTTDK